MTVLRWALGGLIAASLLGTIAGLLLGNLDAAGDFAVAATAALVTLCLVEWVDAKLEAQRHG